MTEKRILDRDSLTGAISTFEYDEGEDRALIHQTTDVGPTLEQNKRFQNDGTGGWTPSRDFRHAARIPNAVIELWRTMYGVDIFNKNHAPAVKRLLNSSEWKFLRVAEFNL